MTVFYSWQSDTRAACNRTLIQDALEGALSDIRGMPTTHLEAVVDRDTLGTPGSPDIATTILEKIDRSSAVIADVTLIDGGSEGRRFPNPNVLLEVGYAIKSSALKYSFSASGQSWCRLSDCVDGEVAQHARPVGR